MTYGKLVSNKIQLVPPAVKYLDKPYSNPDDELLTSLGYKPVVFTVPPEVPEGSTLTVGWTEQTTAIIQTWTLS